MDFLKGKKDDDLLANPPPDIDMQNPYPAPPINQSPASLTGAQLSQMGPMNDPMAPPPAFGSPQAYPDPNMTMGGQPQLNNPIGPPPALPDQNMGINGPQQLPPLNNPMGPPPALPNPNMAPPPMSVPPPPPAQMGPPPMDNMPPAPEPDMSGSNTSAPEGDHMELVTEDIEKIAEDIINKKWDKISTAVNELTTWKKDMDNQIKTLKLSVDKIDSKVSDTQKAILSKVNDYNKSLGDVNVELKAMSKVFDKVLPTFTENVKKLSTITSRISKK